MPLKRANYPDAINPDLVGSYSPLAKAGGGYVWDDVLEYRVWCHPERGASDLEDGSDYYYAFATYDEALAFSQVTEGAEAPLALIRQDEFIDETNPGEYRHVKTYHGMAGGVPFAPTPDAQYDSRFPRAGSSTKQARHPPGFGKA
jgi:hypothetical protein